MAQAAMPPMQIPQEQAMPHMMQMGGMVAKPSGETLHSPTQGSPLQSPSPMQQKKEEEKELLDMSEGGLVKKKELNEGGEVNRTSSEILKSIYSQYPSMRKYNFNVIDSRSTGLKHKRNIGGGKLEFYPPDELYNPNPGKPTIEIFDPNLKGQFLNRAVFGDMLHYIPKVNKNFNNLREKFKASLTPQQKDVDKRAYKYSQQKFGEKRSFDKWNEMTRIDAYIRGYLAPDERDEWRKSGTYTEEQKNILNEMMRVIKSDK